MEECFYPVLNGPKVVKPTGGLWCSNYFSSTFNEWVDYISTKPFYYSNYVTEGNPFNINCVIVTLKDGSSILDISTVEGFKELVEKYKYDFEKVADDYDGIYLDPYKMFDVNPANREEIMRLYSVKTLCLFDLEKVEEYKKGLIVVDPFDYTDYCKNDVYYETIVSERSYQVEGISEEYQKFLEIMYEELKNFVYHLRLEHPDVPSAKLVTLIREEMYRVLGNSVLDYAQQKLMNGERVSNSLAIRTLMKVK